MVQDPDIIAIQEAELNRLMSATEALKRKYDLYFMGMEKREPGVDRERLEIQLRNCRLTAAYKTSTRFKFQQFMARYRSYTGYWDRVLRQMEEGTYRKGFMTESERVARRQNEVAERLADGLDPTTGAASGSPQGDQSADDDQTRLRATAQQAAEFLAGLGGGNSPPEKKPADPLKNLYNNFVSAKEKRGEDTKNVSYERFSKKVAAQRNLARQKYGVDVDFKVKVTGNKVSLVAKKKKSTDKKTD